MAVKVLQLRARCWGLGRSGPPLESQSHGTLTNLIQVVTCWDVQNSAQDDVMSPTGCGHKVISNVGSRGLALGQPPKKRSLANPAGHPIQTPTRPQELVMALMRRYLINQSSRTECASDRECRGPCADGNGEDPKVTRMEQSAADTRRQGPGERLSWAAWCRRRRLNEGECWSDTGPGSAWRGKWGMSPRQGAELCFPRLRFIPRRRTSDRPRRGALIGRSWDGQGVATDIWHRSGIKTSAQHPGGGRQPSLHRRR